jgi:hypothetical protein
MEGFNPKKLNDEDKDEYQIKISNRFAALENLYYYYYYYYVDIYIYIVIGNILERI